MNCSNVFLGSRSRRTSCLLLFALCVMPTLAQDTAAQSAGHWTRDAVRGFLFPTSGDRVGVGTSTPGADLHVHRSGIAGGIGSQLRTTEVFVSNSMLGTVSRSLLTLRSDSSALSLPNAPAANVTAIGTVMVDANRNGLKTMRFNAQEPEMGMTFETRSIERLSIAPGGNVGVGRTNPTHALDVSGDLRVRSNSATNLLLTSSPTDDVLIDLVKQSDTTPAARIKLNGFTNPSTHEGSIEFFTKRASEPALTQRMNITAGGNVGIGTNNPQEQLTVVSGEKIGVFSRSASNVAVSGESQSGNGVFARSTNSIGVFGFSSAQPSSNRDHPAGVHGLNDAPGGVGVFGQADNAGEFVPTGVWGRTLHPLGVAGRFDGDVLVFGSLAVSGDKNFWIDHPVDPENKYLLHASVESSERLNVYSGNAVFGGNGQAWVELPEWLEAVNADFRYQLTSIGGPASLYIAQKIQKGRFLIAGGKPGLEVSWQVTGVRNDAYSQAHPFEIEVRKGRSDRGLFVDPLLRGQPSTQGVRNPRARTPPKE